MKELRIDHGEREPEGSGVPRWVWTVVAVVVVLAGLGGAGWWLLAGRAPTVQTAEAVAPSPTSAVGAVLQATGYVTARRQATVSAQMTGTLTKVLIEEGDRVQAGQVLAQLEDSALKATLNAAQANLLASQAQVTQAQAQLAQAQADEKRQAELLASGMTTRQAAEQSRTAVTNATALLEARRREVDAVRAQVVQAKVNFDYTIVRAPFSGVVTEKAAQVGEIISPLSAGGGFTRTGVGTIVDMDSLEVDVDVNEAYIGQVSPGMPAQAVLDAYPDWKIPSHVIAIVPTADRGKATVKVRIGLDQKDQRLVPQMAVRVAFLNQKTADKAGTPPPVPKGVLVPPSSVVQRDGKTVVFTVADGRAQLRSVTPAKLDVGAMKLLPEGVKAGERVIVAPPENLVDGMKVKVDETAH
ncbi:efflux RND transporter periplasmic adaptor subunit [Piscinibacter terrae]|uniref:efflux RND transporter periplasmic adaptor subunit n=1 Tax=Piscinibacter terrae TaxID=2496871 RepID=UPI0018E0AC51|nr:efflux RND transporter periplasmic adaptor subunit [Albitalea terrae]